MKRSDVESELEDVAVVNDVGFAFEAESSGVFGALKAAGGCEVVVGGGFCADEAAGDVGMDFFGGGDGVVAAAYGPSAAFVVADGEKDDEAEAVPSEAKDAVAGGFGDAEAGHEFGAFGVVQSGDFHFEFSG